MKPIIGFLSNPDKVFYNNLDKVIIKYLVKNGALVMPFNLQDLSILIKRCTSKNENHTYIYNKGKHISFNGFFSYGYMSPSNFKSYQYLLSSLHKLKMPLLYTPSQMSILSDKYMQALQFFKHQVPIPDTGISFGLPGYKSLAKKNFSKFSVLKELKDYGGDGVSMHNNKESLINIIAKKLWNNKLTLIQQKIEDSPGRSIRVLLINNKPVAIAEYVNKVKGEFKSNNSFGYNNFELKCLMGSNKRKEYEDLAIKAVDAISGEKNGKENIVVSGVDILDSNKHGLVVLEVNPWPDLFDIRESTKIDVFDLLAKEFIRKVKKNKIKV